MLSNLLIAFVFLWVLTPKVPAQVVENKEQQETTAVMQQIKELRRRFAEDQLVRILIVPDIINDRGELSAHGFGEVSDDEAAKFVNSFIEGQSEFLLSLPPGKTFRLYFLFRKNGFSDSDVWRCNFVQSSKDTVVWFPMEEGSIRLKLPKLASQVLLGSLHTQVPSEDP